MTLRLFPIRLLSSSYLREFANDNLFLAPGMGTRSYHVSGRPVSLLDYVVSSVPFLDSASEPCFGAQHFPISFELAIPSSYAPSGLRPRPPNFYFNRFDTVRLQTAFEVEFRLVREMNNPSPQFLFSRIMTLLHHQGQVNRQALVPYVESWQFFLSDKDRAEMGTLSLEEQEVSRKIQAGPNLISDGEVRAFYLRYKASFDQWKLKASNKMWAADKDKSKHQGQAWKLLKRIRGSTKAVPIEPGKLLDHFKNIFFDSQRPLAVQYPEVRHRPVYGPFLPDDYDLHEPFSRGELDVAMATLNKEAGVGPGRVSAKWLLRIFETEGSRDLLLFFFNQCFLWGACPREWSESELFVIYKGKGDITDPTNYRAINLLDDFYRLYSRMIYKRLTSWAARYNFFSSAQFGFRQNSGTLEAVFSLQTLVRSWMVRSGQPVYCVFIDIKKAFPSVDRTQLIDLLHHLGLAAPLVRALASTFHLNSCRLRIEGFFTNSFPVNFGVREGDIDSPPMFNLVYGEILRRCDLDLLDENVFVEMPRRVRGIAYADDPATLGLEISPLQETLITIAEAMLPFNLHINAGKTVEMIFLTYRRLIPQSDVIEWGPMFIEGEWIEEASEFKYLGIFLDILCDSEIHTVNCFKRAKQAAVQIGRLCRQMEIRDFSQLRTYFFSFVVSQFHGQQLVSFPPEDYKTVLMLYFRTVFSLPVGYPRAIFYFFVGALEFQAQQIVARLRFFQKHARSRGFLRAAFLEDRRLYLLGQICWNMDFQILFEAFLPNRSFSELDLFDPQEDIHSLLQQESSNRRDLRLTLMPSGVLFQRLVSYQTLPSFLRELSRRSFEETRLVLIFFANMFRFCFFSRRLDSCPLCLVRLDASHHFDCPQIRANCPIDVSDWRGLALRSEWAEFFDLFILVSIVWSRSVRSVRCGHTRTLSDAFRLFLG